MEPNELIFECPTLESKPKILCIIIHIRQSFDIDKIDAHIIHNITFILTSVLHYFL